MIIRTLLILTALSIISLNSHGLVILQYHHISDKTPALTSTSPKLFKKHMQYLDEHQFQILDMKDLPNLLRGKKPLPNHSVIITFDDGFKSIYDNAFPILKKKKWPFTVFVNSKPHDEKNHRYMTWEQLRELAKYKATIANHSDSHLHLIRKRESETKSAWHERRLRDIIFAEQRIYKEIGENPKIFAYPYGEYDADIQRDLKKAGYIAVSQQSGPVSKSNSHQALPRFPFGGNYGDMKDFAIKVNSLPFPLFKIKTTTSDGRLLESPELPKSESRPVLHMQSEAMSFIKGISCFATGQGAIETKTTRNTLSVQANSPLPVGRSRYNCTAQAGGGRYYWYSQLFIKRKSDGSWYDEY